MARVGVWWWRNLVFSGGSFRRVGRGRTKEWEGCKNCVQELVVESGKWFDWISSRLQKLDLSHGDVLQGPSFPFLESVCRSVGGFRTVLPTARRSDVT